MPTIGLVQKVLFEFGAWMEFYLALPDVVHDIRAVDVEKWKTCSQRIDACAAL